MPVHNSDSRSRVGFKARRPGYRFETTDYDHFQLILIRSGQLIADFGAGAQRLGPATALVLPAGSRFALWCDRHGYRGIGVNLRRMDRAPATPGQFTCAPRLRQLADVLEAELIAAEPGHTGVLNAVAIAACRLAVDQATRPGSVPDSQDDAYWARRVQLAIDYHLTDTRNLAGILQRLGLSYRQLSRHFQGVYGYSPKRYQLLRRVEEARMMLQRTNLPVTQIALELGFASSQHFAGRFRELTGQTPRAFRQSTRPRPHHHSPGQSESSNGSSSAGPKRRPGRSRR